MLLVLPMQPNVSDVAKRIFAELADASLQLPRKKKGFIKGFFNKLKKKKELEKDTLLTFFFWGSWGRTYIANGRKQFFF